ncbi:hypothetical protein H072_4981 [Dactylellina haptotyla CBS 200.50]|uniref:Uncharacterized protein n=1 Tax=Dactylellina haptotyla (strain CBS 200.50) TaxID=1284197 RepID=S8BNQ3_DACHA|nr:hypothetical protein H072_4981 [Dactylellina haptotyla CBS 200.50]
MKETCSERFNRWDQHTCAGQRELRSGTDAEYGRFQDSSKVSEYWLPTPALGPGQQYPRLEEEKEAKLCKSPKKKRTQRFLSEDPFQQHY